MPKRGFLLDFKQIACKIYKNMSYNIKYGQNQAKINKTGSAFFGTVVVVAEKMALVLVSTTATMERCAR